MSRWGLVISVRWRNVPAGPVKAGMDAVELAAELGPAGVAGGRKWPRVIFEVPSRSWVGWVGRPTPGRPFTQWPIQYLDTATVRASKR